MTGIQYNVVLSVFFVTYIVFGTKAKNGSA